MMPESAFRTSEVLSLESAGGVWSQMRQEALAAAQAEPALASFLHASILHHGQLEDALSYHMAQKLGGTDFSALQLREICASVYAVTPDLVRKAERDLLAVRQRDPAARTYVQPFLYFKGFAALQGHRIAHALWNDGRDMLAFHLQSRISELFGVDIHPAARIGSGIMIDHATGLVIGETATVGDNVSMLHGVTLGGTGKEGSDRHPKIGNGVLLGAGAKVLGNITIGDYAKVASGSVVLDPVPAGCTVAGVPAKTVGACKGKPSETMDQTIEGWSADWVI